MKTPQRSKSMIAESRSISFAVAHWVGKSPALTVIGALSVVLAISFSALIFKGQLADQLGQGATLMLIGGFVLGVGGAAASSIRGAVLGTQDAPAIILALAAGAIAVGGSVRQTRLEAGQGAR